LQFFTCISTLLLFLLLHFNILRVKEGLRDSLSRLKVRRPKLASIFQLCSFSHLFCFCAYYYIIDWKWLEFSNNRSAVKLEIYLYIFCFIYFIFFSFSLYFSIWPLPSAERSNEQHWGTQDLLPIPALGLRFDKTDFILAYESSVLVLEGEGLSGG
jgi:hypothetical protein